MAHTCERGLVRYWVEHGLWYHLVGPMDSTERQCLEHNAEVDVVQWAAGSQGASCPHTVGYRTELPGRWPWSKKVPAVVCRNCHQLFVAQKGQELIAGELALWRAV